MGIVDKLLGKKPKPEAVEASEKKSRTEPPEVPHPGPMIHMRDNPVRIAADLEKPVVLEVENAPSNSSKKTIKKR